MTAPSGNALKLRLGQPSVAPAIVDWPLTDPDLLAHLEFTTGRYRSGSLGIISEAQAVSTVRAADNSLAFDIDNKLKTFLADTPRITHGKGLWAEAIASCRVDFNGDLTNGAWTTSNATITNNLPTPFAAGSVYESVLGSRVAATVDGDVTVKQVITPVASSTATFSSTPYSLFYCPPGMVFHGPVQITKDDFVVVKDIRPELIEGEWVQIAGIPQLLAGAPANDTLGVRLKDAHAADSIGAMLLNVERGFMVSTPVYTPGTGNVTRNADITTVNLANFPALWNKTRFTVLVVSRPSSYPMPPFNDPLYERRGHTVLEINNPYDITCTGVGKLTPYGGAGEGSLLTWDSVDPGANAQVGERLIVGTGVGNYSDITSQESGTPGGAGTYRVFSTLYPNGQTTTVGITIQSRLKNAQGYALNAALKSGVGVAPADQGIIRIGFTPTNETADVIFGNDPQNESLRLGELNAYGFSVNTEALTGCVALNGDVEVLHTNQFTAAPVLTSGAILNLGSQYPAGGPLYGEIPVVFISARDYTPAEMSVATLALLQIYAGS